MFFLNFFFQKYFWKLEKTFQKYFSQFLSKKHFQKNFQKFFSKKFFNKNFKIFFQKFKKKKKKIQKCFQYF